jgi:hypothetical protein
LIGFVLFGYFEVDEQSTFYERGSSDDGAASNSSSGANAGEPDPAGEEGIVEKRIEGEEGC